MDLNKVTMIGNLTKDPIGKKIASGQSITYFGLATNYSWKDIKTKERKEKVEFHNIIAWGRLGEIVTTYLKKGDKVYIEGRLQNRKWEDDKGEKRSKSEVVAQNLIMLGKASAVKEKVGNEAQKQNATEEVSAEEVPVIEVE
ncbi:single-stranded DNA-binding protein [Patescibacteria group bacterium]|nr:single-stranded DNA-binding protein [Patescibacteria group bacterium]MBU1074834.1 single-stranded DNA-binding protein [Patescibacteria group bacterium]MBU1952161.1 single-stranded DNA-binding protein [Patescibacteria group bacterium]MBU2229111.1 single-stranded DNA-binding protein [Patescibacteria group bacterium]MBU2236114.1 single-stranded DNA-binding protein [Patescibacteria group bacterium]